MSPSVDVEKVVSGLWASLQHNATLRRSVMKQVTRLYDHTEAMHVTFVFVSPFVVSLGSAVCLNPVRLSVVFPGFSSFVVPSRVAL